MVALDDILHFMHLLEKENAPLTVVTQWTKSHTGTVGNNKADALAGEGLVTILELKENDAVPSDVWRWYNKRASCRYNIRPIKREQERVLERKIKSSRFGRVLREEFKRNYRRYPKNVPPEARIGYHWSKRWLRECQDLSRSDIRTLLMLRTGHDRLAYYTYHGLDRGTTPRCPCGMGDQHLHHLLQECILPKVRYLRHNMQKLAKSIFRINLNRSHSDSLKLADTDDYYNDNETIIRTMPQQRYYCNPACYIYPDGRLPRVDRRRLQRAICHFYKLLRRSNQILLQPSDDLVPDLD